MLIKVSIVSLKVSPLDKELFSKLIFIELWPSFFAASSKLTVVLVEGSRNKLNMFLVFLEIKFFCDFLNLIARSAIDLISFADRSSIEVIFFIYH
jgi:hypothetical protein